jgi:hypothetical protein
LIVVILQVLAFQFLALEWTRVLPDYLIGRGGLPEDVAAAVRRFKRSVGRARRPLGAALLVTAALATFAVGDPGLRKLVLAGVSLVSAGVFFGGYLRDRSIVAALASGVPTPSVRFASIEPRTLGRHYPTAWEAVPVVIVSGTIALTVIAMMHGAGLHLVWLTLLEAGVAASGLVASAWYVRSNPPLAQRVKARLGDPTTALEIDSRLRTLELRGFLAVKVGILLLLAVEHGRLTLVALGREPLTLLDRATWFIVVSLLLVFGHYIIAVTRVSRGGKSQ